MNKSLLRKLFPLGIVFLVIVFAMPGNSKFPYDYRKGREWKYETLFAEFDFPIYKTAEQMREERNSMSQTVIPYYKYSDEAATEVFSSAAALPLGRVSGATLSSLRSVYSTGVIADESRRQRNDPAGDSEVIYLQKDKRAYKIPKTEVYGQSDAKAKVLADALHPTSVVRVMQKGPAKARRISGVECLTGAGSWSEVVGSERMRVSAPSFFQVNTKGAEKLVELVMDALSPQADEEAMDLYCGAGTFTLPLARRAGFVSAVESYGPAVRDLRRNLENAGLDNVDPIGGDAGREFPDTDADVIVVDPPRAGLAADVVARLSEQPARAIAYVSCDPATLARDLARFRDAGTFVPVRVTPVDLFPQTYHVETVTLLERA